MTPTRDDRKLTWRFWLAPLMGLLGGLAIVFPGWLGMPGLDALFSSAPRSAEGSAAPFVATLRALRVMLDLAHVLFLGVMGFASAIGTRMARDPVSRLGLALAPCALLGLAAAASQLFLSGALKGVGPGVGTLVVSGLAGMAAGFIALFGDDRSDRDQVRS